MSIKLTLGYTTSDANVVDKNFTAVGTEVTAIIKEDTSIIDPVFLLSGTPATYALCNYVQTTNFGSRQYFIRKIVTAGNGMIEVHCHCDVLSSFATPLKNLDAVIERQENDFNLYLDDGSFKVYANPHVITKEFSAGFSTPCFVMGLWGGAFETPTP